MNKFASYNFSHFYNCVKHASFEQCIYCSKRDINLKDCYLKRKNNVDKVLLEKGLKSENDSLNIELRLTRKKSSAQATW